MMMILGFLWGGIGKLPAWVWVGVVIVLLLAAVYFEGDAHGKKVTTTAWEARWAAQEKSYAQVAATAEAKHAADLRDAQARNQEVIDAFHKTADERDALRADADRSLSLLNAARAAAAGSSRVPEAGPQPGAPATGPSGGDAALKRLSDLEAAALGECDGNAEQLNALLKELKPQL